MDAWLYYKAHLGAFGSGELIIIALFKEEAQLD